MPSSRATNGSSNATGSESSTVLPGSASTSMNPPEVVLLAKAQARYLDRFIDKVVKALRPQSRCKPRSADSRTRGS